HLPRPDFRQCHKHMPRREKHERDRRSFVEIQTLRDWNTVHGRHFYKLRGGPFLSYTEDPIFPAHIVASTETHLAVPAREAGRNENPVSRLRPIDGASYFGDNAGAVGSGDVRQRNLSLPRSAADPAIEVIERGRLHIHKNIGWTDGGFWGVFMAEDIGVAERVEADRLHFIAPLPIRPAVIRVMELKLTFIVSRR